MAESERYTGTLYIISAPSGAGKTSLVKALIEQDKNIQVSISHTTRAPRPGETDGKEYFFIDKASFEEKINNSEFLEHARVFDNYYGTSKTQVEQNLRKGVDVILEIDWQGAEQVKRLFDTTVSIFILPPSRQALESRLKNRGQDSEAVIQRRMMDAVNEISHYVEFDYLLVNDDFDQALQSLGHIFMANRLKFSIQQQNLQGLLTDLLAYSSD